MDAWAELGIELRGRSRGQIKTFCPKCHSTRRHQRDPSLSVNVDQGVYKCHNPGCDFAGVIPGMATGGYGSPLRSFTRPTRPESHAAYTSSSTGLTAFLRGRSIRPDIAAAAQVEEDTARNAIAFQYFLDGELVHIKYRSLTDKRFWSTAESEPVFYNRDVLKSMDPDDTLYIVEGELDCLSMVQAGYTTTVSLPNGAMNPGDSGDGKLYCLGEAADLIDKIRRVVIATDGDSAGTFVAEEITRRIGPAKCWRVTWPTGMKDANQVVMEQGEDALRDIIDAAWPSPVDGLVYAQSIKSDLWNTRDTFLRDGLHPGWEQFAELYRPGPGQLTIVTGVPGSGKSAFIMDMLVRICQRVPTWKVAIFTPEQSPPKMFFGDLVQNLMEKPVWEAELAEYEAAMEWINEHVVLIELGEEPTLENILEKARVCILRHGINGLVIDPYTEVETIRMAGVTEAEQIKHALGTIRRFGKHHLLHTWVAAHPTKVDPARVDEPITPYQISGSASWYNKADAILSVFITDREARPSPVEVHVQKMRFRNFGRRGMQRFNFNLHTAKYTEASAPSARTQFMSGNIPRWDDDD